MSGFVRHATAGRWTPGESAERGGTRDASLVGGILTGLVRIAARFQAPPTWEAFASCAPNGIRQVPPTWEASRPLHSSLNQTVEAVAGAFSAVRTLMAG